MGDLLAVPKAGADGPRETRVERVAKFFATLAAGVLGFIALAYVLAQALGLGGLVSFLAPLRPAATVQAPVPQPILGGAGLVQGTPQTSPPIAATRPAVPSAMPVGQASADTPAEPEASATPPRARSDHATAQSAPAPAPLSRGDLAGLRAVLLPSDPSPRSQDTWPVAALSDRMQRLGMIMVASPEAADLRFDVRFVARDAGIAPAAESDSAFQRREAGSLAVYCRHAQGRPCPSFEHSVEVVGRDQAQLQRHAIEDLVAAWFDAFAR